MATAQIFREAFLDGFTMAGLRKLRSPASPDAVFAPEEQPVSPMVSFQVSERDASEIRVQGDLHGLTLGALESIMRAVSAEQKSRSRKDALAHGSGR